MPNILSMVKEVSQFLPTLDFFLYSHSQFQLFLPGLFFLESVLFHKQVS